MLTICIPTYNRAEALDSCLFAICTQIEFDSLAVQVVISDNCSSDQTKEISEKWVRRNAFVKYFRNDENIGGIKNFWRVSQYVNTEYFWFVGDDALLLPGAIRHVVNLITSIEDLDFLLLAGTNNAKDQNQFIQDNLNENGVLVTSSQKKEFLSSFWLQTLGCISYLIIRTDLWSKSNYEQQPACFIYPQIRSLLEICAGSGNIAFSNKYCVHSYRASSTHNDWYISKGAVSITYEFPWLQQYAKSLGYTTRYRDGLHKRFLWWKLKQWILLLAFHPYYERIYDDAIAQQEGADRYIMSILRKLAPFVRAIVGFYVPKSRKDLLKKDDLMKSA